MEWTQINNSWVLRGYIQIYIDTPEHKGWIKQCNLFWKLDSDWVVMKDKQFPLLEAIEEVLGEFGTWDRLGQASKTRYAGFQNCSTSRRGMVMWSTTKCSIINLRIRRVIIWEQFQGSHCHIKGSNIWTGAGDGCWRDWSRNMKDEVLTSAYGLSDGFSSFYENYFCMILFYFTEGMWFHESFVRLWLWSGSL